MKTSGTRIHQFLERFEHMICREGVRVQGSGLGMWVDAKNVDRDGRGLRDKLDGVRVSVFVREREMM